jgi:threonine/homoserine/homoserine lactone efflux protein
VAVGHGLLGFAVVAALLVLAPGPDFAVVLPSALRSRRAGVATASGTATGLAVHAVIAALGLSVLLQSSALAFTVVKLAGAVFLGVLGVRAVAASRRRAPGPGRPVAVDSPPSVRKAYLRGLLVNILNPKAPIIYLSVMPQFLDAGQPVTTQLAIMSTTLVTLALTWYVLLSLLVQPFKKAILRVRHWIDRVSGTALIVLGVRLALAQRPT